MDSFPTNRLTQLQRDLVAAFFAREQRYVLTGGAALAGFYLGHRETRDLGFFTHQETDLEGAVSALRAAVESVGATLAPRTTTRDFRRFLVQRAQATCLIDLVIDRTSAIDPEPTCFGLVRVDTLREIAANKLCTLLSRNEGKDLFDMRALVSAGIDLGKALEDAARKDAGMDPATLAWTLETSPKAAVTGVPVGCDPEELDRFRHELARRLRTLAFEQSRKE